MESSEYSTQSLSSDDSDAYEPHLITISKTSLLSDVAIEREMANGNIIIKPFSQSQLSTTSYDVKLGRWFYRETKPEFDYDSSDSSISSSCEFGDVEDGSLRRGKKHSTPIYNPYSKEMVTRVWGMPQQAQTQLHWIQSNNETDNQVREKVMPLKNVALDELIIWIEPGETILGHTEEFIGGKNSITTMMKARSSMGRNFIEVCKCAGWGDVGYVNRWTMEITNNSRYYKIPLVVGRRIAQIVFFDTEGIKQAPYESSGKYQSTSDLSVMIDTWDASCMLPKMYKDREVTDNFYDSDD